MYTSILDMIKCSSSCETLMDLFFSFQSLTEMGFSSHSYCSSWKDTLEVRGLLQQNDLRPRTGSVTYILKSILELMQYLP